MILERAEIQRKEAIANTDEFHRQKLGQHLTPKETAALAASLMSDASDHLTCLDLGAGTGMLSSALVARYKNLIKKCDAVELDGSLAAIYDNEIRPFVEGETIVGDALYCTPNGLYDRIILNPPYKKMSSKDERQALLPVPASNLYIAFMEIALTRLAPDGEMVAIVPRSWMNGEYFRKFRIWALENYSLDCLHIYKSRSDAFKDTAVLQETIIVRFSNRSQTDAVIVSESINQNGNIETNAFSAPELIDTQRCIVRVSPNPGYLKDTISTLGLCPSTGKIVDFRNRDLISMDKPQSRETYPLVYPSNFREGYLKHPADCGKPQWFTPDSESSYGLMLQPGFYTVIKRFSSKEEKKRVVAYPLEVHQPIALENHMNFIHKGSPRKVVPLDSLEIAQGLALWLNSTYIDQWFRDLSGSTQVNASDIKILPSPSLEELKHIGFLWEPGMNQKNIDSICGGLYESR